MIWFARHWFTRDALRCLVRCDRTCTVIICYFIRYVYMPVIVFSRVMLRQRLLDRCPATFILLTLLAYYTGRVCVTVGCPSVRLSVTTAASACGWFAAERRVGGRYWSIAAGAPTPRTSCRPMSAAGAGTQQQTGVACVMLEPSDEAQHRLVPVVVVANCGSVDFNEL